MSARFSTELERGVNAQSSFAEPTGDSYKLEDVTFLRLPEVKAVTGLSKTSLYALIRNRNFPSPVRLGPRAVAWVRSEVKQWATNRVLESRTKCLPNGKLAPQSVHSRPGAPARISA